MKAAHVLAAIGLVIVTALAARTHWHDPNAARDARLIAIENHVAQAKGGVLLVGDSTAERWNLPTLCGLPVTNTGLGRAKAADLLPRAQEWKARVEPVLIVASIGNNDSDPETAARAFAKAIGADYLVPISFGERPDGVHFSERDYARLSEMAAKAIC